jgi:hypothetical protein
MHGVEKNTNSDNLLSILLLCHIARDQLEPIEFKIHAQPRLNIINLVTIALRDKVYMALTQKRKQRQMAEPNANKTQTPPLKSITALKPPVLDSYENKRN